MRRLGEVLPEVAAGLGIEHELTRSRQMAAWQRLIGELVPGATGASSLLAVQPPALVVSAATPIVGQEIRLRATELLGAFAATRDGVRLLELRVVVRPATAARPSPGPSRGPV